VNPIRTVGGRLALALLVVVGGALAIVYLIVVPSYESSLVAGKLKDVRKTLAAIEKQPRGTSAEVFPSNAWIEDEAEPFAEGARVVAFDAPPLLAPVADSNPGTSVDIAHDPVAARAATRTGMVSGTATRDGASFAEAAVSLHGPVLLVSTPLHNDLESAAVVRDRVVVAASVATAFAIALGYLLASLFARRIRRLERAAERIAGGDFGRPVVDDAPDELGQLARAFERMRLQLASLDHARGEFIANASHELRTPLFSLGGFLELLTSDDEVDAETRSEFLAEMQAQVARLTKLATDLLDLSRMDAGRLDVVDEGFDLAAALEVLATEFGPRAVAAGQTLELDAPAPAFARGDETRVLQIGRILIENAVVHTPPGTTIALSASVRGEVATLSVSDDGPGIPPAAAGAIFERFYRLGGRVASGSGLGLAIARELARLMTGRIELDSRPGSTRFTLVLAADPAPQPEILETARKG
jgi:signal transduction histidine kinase